MIERMSGHEVVCGYGRMGRAVVDELQHTGRQVVVVDSRVSRMQELAETGLPTVAGAATLEATLLSANLQHARGLVSCLSDDAHKVYTVLTARTLNPDLFIVARATEEGAERRILQAGANRVVNPYHLGGARLAHLVVKPAIVNFFDASVRRLGPAARPDLAQREQLGGGPDAAGSERATALGARCGGRAAGG